MGQAVGQLNGEAVLPVALTAMQAGSSILGCTTIAEDVAIQPMLAPGSMMLHQMLLQDCSLGGETVKNVEKMSIKVCYGMAMSMLSSLPINPLESICFQVDHQTLVLA